MGLRMDEFARMSLAMYEALVRETLSLRHAAGRSRRGGRRKESGAPTMRGSLADCP